jgi:putative oxygen-independent coproporphyrinogen III oxidase
MERATGHRRAPPAVYVHIPFCASRCDYCAFATWTDRHHLRSRYVEACIEHAKRTQRAPAPTLYLGGGTPSQLDPDDLTRLVAAIDVEPGAEVTIEANPEDVTPDWAAAAADAGATRISLGVQSLDACVLEGLGRRHDPAAVARAATAIASAGIPSYSVDLIYGGAGETDDSWRTTLDEVRALDPPPEHVSAYALTVEPGTPLWRDHSRHPDDDVQATRYEIADRAFTEAGLEWYEISNWAKPGHESRHNWNYWMQGDYLAIGAAAHGHLQGHRWWHVRTPERYIAAIERGKVPTAASEILDPHQRTFEALELSLRTRAGVPAAVLPLGEDPDFDRLLHTAPGNPDRLVLTLAGRLLANEVARCLRTPPSLSRAAGSDHSKHQESALHSPTCQTRSAG